MNQPIYVLPTLEFGGIETAVLRNIQAMDKARFRYSVAVTWPDRQDPMRSEFERHATSLIDIRLRCRLFPLAVCRLVKFVRNEKVDLIHCNNSHWDRRLTVTVKKLTRVPIINTFHNDVFSDVNSFSSRLERCLSRGEFDQVLTSSADILVSWKPYIDEMCVPANHRTVIHPGLEIERFPTEMSESDTQQLRRKSTARIARH